MFAENLIIQQIVKVFDNNNLTIPRDDSEGGYFSQKEGNLLRIFE
jgi:hypothetical protein